MSAGYFDPSYGVQNPLNGSQENQYIAQKTYTLQDGTTLTRSGAVVEVALPNGGVYTIEAPVGYVHSSSLEQGSAFRTQFHEGTVEKLSKEKGLLGGDKWQTRFLRLKEDFIAYFLWDTSEEARGIIYFTPGTYVAPVRYYQERRKDAFMMSQQNSLGAMMSNPLSVLSEYDGVVGKSNAFALHVPKPPLAMSQGIVNALNTNIFSVANSIRDAQEANRTRTYYFGCSSPQERDRWVDAINNNLTCLATGDSFQQNLVEDFRHKLESCGLNVGTLNITEILDALFDPVQFNPDPNAPSPPSSSSNTNQQQQKVQQQQQQQQQQQKVQHVERKQQEELLDLSRSSPRPVSGGDPVVDSEIKQKYEMQQQQQKQIQEQIQRMQEEQQAVLQRDKEQEIREQIQREEKMRSEQRTMRERAKKMRQIQIMQQLDQQAKNEAFEGFQGFCGYGGVSQGMVADHQNNIISMEEHAASLRQQGKGSAYQQQQQQQQQMYQQQQQQQQQQYVQNDPFNGFNQNSNQFNFQTSNGGGGIEINLGNMMHNNQHLDVANQMMQNMGFNINFQQNNGF